MGVMERRKRRAFTKEFKAETVRLVVEGKRPIAEVARDLDLVAPGYRLLANTGTQSGQEVPHLHVHLFGGRAMGPMLTR